MRITVSADTGMDRFAALLAAVPAKARRVFVEGLNEGGDLERTKVRRNLKTQTGVLRYGAIVQRTHAKRASASGLVYSIDGTGKGMPIKEFRVRAGLRSPVTAYPWAVAHTFARSFQTSRQGLLRARIGAARKPIRALYGGAVSKEIVQGETAADFQASAAPTVSRMVMKRLARVMP